MAGWEYEVLLLVASDPLPRRDLAYLLAEVARLGAGPHCLEALGMASAGPGKAGLVGGKSAAAAAEVGMGAVVRVAGAKVGHRHRRVAVVVHLGCARLCVPVQRLASVPIRV